MTRAYGMTAREARQKMAEDFRASPLKFIGKALAWAALGFATLYVLFYVIGDEVPWIQEHQRLILLGICSFGYIHAGWLTWKRKQYRNRVSEAAMTPHG